MTGPALTAREDAIAVIGLSGRFPGAPSVDALWDLLRRGERGISTFTDEELLAAGVPPAHLADPRYVKARGALAGIDLFDAEHFGFLPREAALLDPQRRLLLEFARRRPSRLPELAHGRVDPGDRWSGVDRRSFHRRRTSARGSSAR